MHSRSKHSAQVLTSRVHHLLSLPPLPCLPSGVSNADHFGAGHCMVCSKGVPSGATHKDCTSFRTWLPSEVSGCRPGVQRGLGAGNCIACSKGVPSGAAHKDCTWGPVGVWCRQLHGVLQGCAIRRHSQRLYLVQDHYGGARPAAGQRPAQRVVQGLRLGGHPHPQPGQLRPPLLTPPPQVSMQSTHIRSCFLRTSRPQDSSAGLGPWPWHRPARPDLRF